MYNTCLVYDYLALTDSIQLGCEHNELSNASSALAGLYVMCNIILNDGS